MRNNNSNNRKGVMGRLIKTIFEFYPVLLPIVVGCIIFNAVVSAIPAVFMQNIIASVENTWQSGDWNAVSGKITQLVLLLVVCYVLSLIASFTFNRLMAIITQGSLKKFRVKMFNGMQDLPIKYFDTHNHGDIMSYYTNDIDTLRQMVSQSIPQLLISSITVLTVFSIMLYFSVWMTIVVVCGVILMFFVTKKVGGNSAKYFVRQQVALGKVEGFVEEIMNGQKVVQVFCHERESEADFDRLNEELFHDAENANKFANILMPVLGNIGNILYVAVALTGGILLLSKAPNLSISGMAIGISIVVPFLNMTKQFAGNISQVSNQVNSVVMGLAAVIIGSSLFERFSFIKATTLSILGAVIYKCAIALVLKYGGFIGLTANDLKLMTAIIVVIALCSNNGVFKFKKKIIIEGGAGEDAKSNTTVQGI